MRAASAAISSAIVLAIAVFSSSATVASLDVELREPAPQDRIGGGAVNATSEISINLDKNNCEVMKYTNWDEFKHACTWEHVATFTTYYNHFFMRFDGSVVKDCVCSKGLWIYNPWHPRWTYSETRYVTCYTRDGRDVSEVKRAFDAYTC